VARAPHSDHTHPRLIVRQISLLNSVELLTIPPPTTASPFRHDRFVTLLHRRGLPRLSPWEASFEAERIPRRAVKGSIIARSLPDRLGRNEFVILRTGHSPQVALHPFSRKRSYHCRFQAGNVSPVGTCTLLFNVAFTGALARLSEPSRLALHPLSSIAASCRAAAQAESTGDSLNTIRRIVRRYSTTVAMAPSISLARRCHE